MPAVPGLPSTHACPQHVDPGPYRYVVTAPLGVDGGAQAAAGEEVRLG
jgi:hypothetical protein